MSFISALTNNAFVNIDRFAKSKVLTKENLPKFRACVNEIVESGLGHRMATVNAMAGLVGAFDSSPFSYTSVAAYGMSTVTLEEIVPVITKHFGNDYKQVLSDVAEAVEKKICEQQPATTKAFEEASDKLVKDKQQQVQGKTATDTAIETGAASDAVIITEIPTYPIKGDKALDATEFGTFTQKIPMVCGSCAVTRQKKNFRKNGKNGKPSVTNLVSVPEGLGDTMIHIGKRMFLANVVDGCIVCGTCKQQIDQQINAESKRRKEGGSTTAPQADTTQADADTKAAAAKAAEEQAAAEKAATDRRIKELNLAIKQANDEKAEKQKSINTYTISRDRAKQDVESAASDQAKDNLGLILASYEDLLAESAEFVKGKDAEIADLTTELNKLKG